MYTSERTRGKQDVLFNERVDEVGLLTDDDDVVAEMVLCGAQDVQVDSDAAGLGLWQAIKQQAIVD